MEPPEEPYDLEPDEELLASEDEDEPDLDDDDEPSWPA
jgi:hypothetical protein